jgi:hypothetical protein
MCLGAIGSKGVGWSMHLAKGATEGIGQRQDPGACLFVNLGAGRELA